MLLRRSRRLSCTSKRLRRRFSAEKTTDEKASEVAKEGFPTVKKYSPIWVPAVVLIVIAVDIINNENHRDVIEDIAPSYVNFVREYHGFSDEDMAKKQRVKKTILSESEPVSVLIELTSGATHIEANVDGRQPYGDLYLAMQQKYRTEGDIQQISFADSDSGALSSSSMVEELEKPSEEEAGYHVVPIAGHPLQRSLWDYNAGSSISSRIGSTNSSNSNSSTSSGELSSDVLMRPFENITGTLMASWRAYKKVENKNRLLVKDRDVPQASTQMSSSSGGASRGAKDTSNFTRMMQANEAKNTIASLQQRILELKQERRLGSRDIDDIETDIRSANAEITRLQRTFLNWFYWF
jgi:hypothetical protein